MDKITKDKITELAKKASDEFKGIVGNIKPARTQKEKDELHAEYNKKRANMEIMFKRFGGC